MFKVLWASAQLPQTPTLRILLGQVNHCTKYMEKIAHPYRALQALYLTKFRLTTVLLGQVKPRNGPVKEA
jgi:hypothetical protein